MSIKNFFDGGKQVSDNAGLPLNGGKCYFYEPGTTTLKTTYTTSALSVANANPVVLDSAGRANIWLSGNYRVIVKDSTDATTIYDEDNINPETTSTLTAITADTTLVLADKAEFFQASGAITITLTAAATLGAGWYVYIRNNGSNNITITGANTGNTFNGTTFASATYTLYAGVSVFVVVNAAATGFITYGSVEAGGANLFTGTLTMSGKSILDANASVAAAAATSDIWSTGNYVTLTGTAVTFTDFADAPQAGAEMEVYCNAAHIFTDNANLEVDGDANFQAEAGDRVLVRAKSTTVFTVHPRKKIGPVAVAILEDQKSSTTNGGTFTSGSAATRDLNTEVSDPRGIVTLAANQFTLGAGSYLIEWSAPAFQVALHQSTLYNVTSASTVKQGSSEHTAAANTVTSRSIGSYFIALSASATYEIRHQCSTTKAGDGYGSAVGLGGEVYTQVKITKF